MEHQRIYITKETARKYLLLKQGLYGPYRFEKKPGAYTYVRQAGCIQFDPVDSVGKNAELTLQSRVKGFTKKHLFDLLYKDRLLVDYFDKELAIFPTEDWPYFRIYRELCRQNGDKFEGLKELEQEALVYIKKHGNVCSTTLPIEGEIHWHSSIHWSGNWHGKAKASRSVLEQLYTTGDLIIHHKEGARKYYDLAEKYLDKAVLTAEDPLPEAYDHAKWRIKRRIGAVGMLWNKNSSAFLGIPNLTPETRSRIFREMLDSGETLEVLVEGIRTPLYLLTEDLPYLEQAQDLNCKSRRVEFLAPLDPLLWDRSLIEKIFDFSYSWEIYTPPEKRKYGYYVLPILEGDRLIGRIEPVIQGGVLKVQGLWLEEGIKPTKQRLKAIDRRLATFAKFNDCVYEPDFADIESLSHARKEQTAPRGSEQSGQAGHPEHSEKSGQSGKSGKGEQILPDTMVLVKGYIPDVFIELPYATEHNFMGKVIYDFNDAYLRYGTTMKLKKVQEKLKEHGLSLKIWDAYRPPKAQFKMWEVMPNSTFVANPHKGFSNHSRGNTVDVTLVTRTGAEVPMPTPFDDFTEKASRNYDWLPEETRYNIVLLENLMKDAGFNPLYDEWWHYSDQEDYPVVEELS